MFLKSGTARLRGLKRFATITRVLVRHGLGDITEWLFARGSAKDVAIRRGFPSPVRIRKLLEELGPSFIKLGQLMSTRADIFPSAYIEEFTRLQDRVPPVPVIEIETVIQKELKQPVNKIFAEFEPQAIAAASVAQVHKATLKSGETVAVKVIRPGIEKKIREDIRLMYYLGQKIESAFEIARILGLVNLVKEFERTIFRELDMLIEAGSIQRFAKNFEKIDEIYIPKVYWDYISKSVLVMEHIEGIKMDQVDQIVAHGLDPKEVALIGLRSFSRQLMEIGFFHADPHPGNTIVMYDGRVGLVDFGITGYLDNETMTQIANLFLGYAEHDYDMVMDAFMDAELIDSDKIDLKSFRIDLKEISEPFYGRSLATISVKDVYDQVMQLITKYHIRLPRNLLLLFKTLIQTESLGKILGSDASLLEVTRPYAKKLLQKGYDAQKLIKGMGRDLKEMSGYMRGFPRFAHDILRRTAAGRHRMELRHTGLNNMILRLEKGINRFTIGVIIAASTIAGALVLNASNKVLSINFGLFGLGPISITEILGLSGYTIATILGLWLIYSIFRSGKL
jgi:ubiquinone biosynthesis protein